MSMRIVRLAGKIESQDDFHVARLLLLLDACAGRSGRSVEGITKLAKLDFLLRYPTCMERALTAVNRASDVPPMEEHERDTIEGRMIRFRYGPWDGRYRRWIALLVSKGLAATCVQGRTVHVKLTDSGTTVARQLQGHTEFAGLTARSKAIASAFRTYSATGIKDFVYKTFPEIIDMKWGESIDL
jgi:hypothetical protein